MKISIETGNFKLDGGAMFGVVPKSLWKELILQMIKIYVLRLCEVCWSIMVKEKF